MILYTFVEKDNSIVVDRRKYNCDYECAKSLGAVVDSIGNPEIGPVGQHQAIHDLFENPDAINNPQVFYDIIKNVIDDFNSLDEQNKQYIQQGNPIPPNNKLPVNYAKLVKQNNDLLKWMELYIKKYVNNPEINTPIDYADSVEQIHDSIQQLKLSVDELASNKQKERINSDAPRIISGGEDYIKPELLVMLQKVEKKIQPQFESWNKIKIAAWVDLLMDNNYFLPEYKRTHRRKNCKAFAKARYKTDINTQMLVKEDASRKTHKLRLLYYFKD